MAAIATPTSHPYDELMENNSSLLVSADELESGPRDETSEEMSEEDAIALVVGLSAHEYLEDCFCTEASVLDREKFNAVPEIPESDFTVMGHLGNGAFSDVFEVVREERQLLRASCGDLERNNRRLPSRRGSSRSTIDSSAATTDGERHRSFALKCLRPSIRSNADQFAIGAEDLVHETALLANLDHPNIIQLHGRAPGNLVDAFVMNGGYFIMLDRLEETLHDRISAWKKSPKSLLARGPGSDQIEVARSIADALSYLHSKNIVFRDLKPDNVGFDSEGVLKLFDFGLAVGMPEKDESNPDGLLFDRAGTPRYMAPEVALDLGYGLEADVYSFGMLLWEVCALTKPFASIKTRGQFEREVFAGAKRPPIKGRWPAGIKETIESCWDADPSQRPSCWRDVKSSLELAMASKPNKKKSPMKVGSSLVRSVMTGRAAVSKIKRHACTLAARSA